MNNTLKLVKFYIQHSNVNVEKLGDIQLVNNNGDNFKLIKTELRKNLPPIITLSNYSNKNVLYNLDALNKTFASANTNSEILIALNKFYELKSDEIKQLELEKIRQAEEKEKKRIEAEKAEYKKKLAASLESHKIFLSNNKIDYKGYQIGKVLRTSSCYYCHSKVSTKRNYVCNSCNALICLCGKCLCVWNKNFPTRN